MLKKLLKPAVLSVLAFMLTLSLFSPHAFALKSNASPNIYLRTCHNNFSVWYVDGGIYESTYEKVSSVSAYMELYRDGTYLGSSYDIDDLYRPSGLRSAAANISSCTHNTFGFYVMNWNSRLSPLTGSDVTNSGSVNILKNK